MQIIRGLLDTAPFRIPGAVGAARVVQMKVRLVTAGALCLLPLTAAASAGWTEYVKVAELVPTSRHYYELRLPVSKNPSGCREQNWFYQNYDTSGSAHMFEVLLKSLSTDIRLRIYVTGVCNLNGYAEFTSVSVIP